MGLWFAGALQHWLLHGWRCLCAGQELLPVRVSLRSLPSPYYQIFWSWDGDVSPLTLPFCPLLLSFVPGVGFPPGCSVHRLCHQWPSGAGRSPGVQLETVQPHAAPGPARVIQLRFCHHEAHPVKSASMSRRGFFFLMEILFLV